jgi:two-component system, OmpR family, response regulator CpxR
MDRILIIDDDVELTELLTEYLASEGLVVESAHDGEEGVRKALSGEHALVILDVMLPGISGFEVLRRLRGSASLIPVIMLTARGDDVDRIVGLEMGADDYLPKPFNSRELVARIRAILRRTAREDDGSATKTPLRKLKVGDIEMDLGSLEALCRGEAVELTAVEFRLLEVLLRSAGLVLSREELTKEVLGRSLTPYDRSIDVHVSRLRRKLGAGPHGRERVKSVRNSGYMYLREADTPDETRGAPGG